MRPGKMYKPGDVILANIQYTDTYEIKTRPALILYQEHDNIITAGITSNPKMDGIPLTKKEGAVKESVIKLNYIFTISKNLIKKKLFHLDQYKKNKVYEELNKKIKQINRA